MGVIFARIDPDPQHQKRMYKLFYPVPQKQFLS